jgi:hypothetical protein
MRLKVGAAVPSSEEFRVSSFSLRLMKHSKKQAEACTLSAARVSADT